MCHHPCHQCMYEWVNETYSVKALWVVKKTRKVLYKYSPFTICHLFQCTCLAIIQICYISYISHLHKVSSSSSWQYIHLDFPWFLICGAAFRSPTNHSDATWRGVLCLCAHQMRKKKETHAVLEWQLAHESPCKCFQTLKLAAKTLCLAC